MPFQPCCGKPPGWTFCSSMYAWSLLVGLQDQCNMYDKIHPAVAMCSLPTGQSMMPDSRRFLAEAWVSVAAAVACLWLGHHLQCTPGHRADATRSTHSLPDPCEPWPCSQRLKPALLKW